MTDRFIAWLTRRPFRVVAAYRGAIWECRLCPATGWEGNGPQAYDAAARHLADKHGTAKRRADRRPAAVCPNCELRGFVVDECPVCLGRGFEHEREGLS